MSHLPITAIALLLLCPAWPAFAAAADLQADPEPTTGGDAMGSGGGPVSLETFTAPQPIEMAQPEVPAQYLRRGREAWVHLNFRG